MSSQNKKIKCPRPDCKNTAGEYQYLGEAKSMTIVNEDGKVTFNHGTYIYKCMSCLATFETDIPPQIKRILNG